jgi:plasmid stability protein
MSTQTFCKGIWLSVILVPKWNQMKTITLKNFPEELLVQLKVRAKTNNRSLNSEIIHILKGSCENSTAARQQIMEHARKIRESIKQRLSNEEINDAKSRGRA